MIPRSFVEKIFIRRKPFLPLTTNIKLRKQMKNMDNNRLSYAAPTAQALEFRVEQGFTVSPVGGGTEAPGGDIQELSLTYDSYYDGQE